MRCILSVIVVLLACAGVAQASPLNLSVSYPLVTADYLSASYDANGVNANLGRMTATAYVDNWTPTSSSASLDLIPFGSFQAIFEIVPTTGVATGGSLYVTGNMDGLNNDAELLISSSTLVGFSWGGANIFNAVFRQDTGTAFAPQGAGIGLIMDVRGLPTGQTLTFSQDWGPSDELKADLFVMAIPEPATMSLLGIGAGVLAFFRRRSR